MLETAGIPNMLRTILIIVLFYYIFKLLRLYVFPIILRWVVKKGGQKVEAEMRRRAQQQQQSQSGAETIKDDGQIKVERVKNTRKSNENDDLGDYIDYEEV